jgi:hypothetical protein
MSSDIFNLYYKVPEWVKCEITNKREYNNIRMWQCESLPDKPLAIKNEGLVCFDMCHSFSLNRPDGIHTQCSPKVSGLIF